MATPVLVNGTTGLLATALQVRGQSCNLLGYHIYNPSNATAYIQFFDSLLGPTVGTTVPVWSIGIPTLTSTFMPVDVNGIFFSLGLWVAATTTAGGSSAPNAAVNVNLGMS